MNPLEKAINERDLAQAVDALLVLGQDRQPEIRLGYGRETELWDFKEGLPGLRAENDSAWARVATHVAGLHNNRGGLLLFGIRDRDHRFVGTRDYIDAKRFNDKLRRYLGDELWVDFAREYVQADQRYLGVALVPRRGLIPIRMRADAPPDGVGNRLFRAGDLCVRLGDETKTLTGSAVDTYLSQQRLPSPDARFLVRESGYRILRPDWSEFVTREELCDQVKKALADDRTYVVSLTGIGGVGKTALACWGVLDFYKSGAFQYIASVSAKDRELTPRGMEAVTPSLGSFEDLLNEILEVTGFSDLCALPIDARESAVRELLPEARSLLFVDNLETVDDPRVIRFLETLPKPVKAITTSRTSRVKTAAFPISVGPLGADEAMRFLAHCATAAGRQHLRQASRAEQERIVAACHSVPLVIEWLVGQSPTVQAALAFADALAQQPGRDEQLLEFCFRRVHSELTPESRQVLAALALDEQPMGLEACSAATGLLFDETDSCLAALDECSLVEKIWDDRLHDYAFRVLPLTRRFAYRDLQRVPGEEHQLRRRLTDWYQAKDVEEHMRPVMQSVRRGTRDPEASLVEAAVVFRRQGKIAEAEKYFGQAIGRNPKSWRARREYAELLRDQGSVGAALDQYRAAALQAPARGNDRALIFREWGMLLQRSGQADADRQAIEKFEIARKETPNDPVLLHALATSLCRRGHYLGASGILEELIASTSAKTRSISYDLLEKCYDALSEPLKLESVRQRRAGDSAASRLSERPRVSERPGRSRETSRRSGRTEHSRKPRKR